MLSEIKDIHWNIQNDDGLSPIMEAIKRRNVECLEILRNKVDWNLQDDNGDTAVMWAVSDNNVKCLEFMTQVPGVEWNIQNNQGLTAAILALKMNDAQCVQMLTNVPSIDWNLQDRRGFTAVMWNVQIHENNDPCLGILKGIDGINWNMKNCVGDSALAIALKLKRFETVKFLFALPNIEVDVEELKHKDILAQASDCCKEYVLERMGGEKLDTIKTDHILSELMYSLENDFSASIIQILVSSASTWDIISLVNYGMKSSCS